VLIYPSRQLNLVPFKQRNGTVIHCDGWVNIRPLEVVA